MLSPYSEIQASAAEAAIEQPATPLQARPIGTLGLEHSPLWKPGVECSLGPRFFFFTGGSFPLFWICSELPCTTSTCAYYSHQPDSSVHLSPTPPSWKGEGLCLQQERGGAAHHPVCYPEGPADHGSQAPTADTHKASKSTVTL